MNNRLFRTSLLAIVMLSFSARAFAQENLGELSLEELMNTPISVASQKSTNAREAPGIVTVFTKEDIRNSGMHDLIDLLQLVPGFNIGTDTDGAFGLGFRGIWAQEGKILLLVDGIQMQENLYSCLAFGHHYPLGNAEKIEIIRGSGSVQYGGNAELAVIKITSQNSGTSGDQVHAWSEIGGGRKGLINRDIDLAANKIVNGTQISLEAFTGSAVRSDRDYTDKNGLSYNLSDASKIDPLWLNFGLSQSNFDFRFIFDRYNSLDRTGYDNSAAQPMGLNFTSYSSNFTYHFTLSPQFKVSSYVFFRIESPWNVNNPDANVAKIFYDKSVTRKKAGVITDYDLSDSTSFSNGFDFTEDSAINHVGNFSNGQNHVNYYNFSAFTELAAKIALFNFTLGGRYDQNTSYGNSFVPRFAITHKDEIYHYKFLFSDAFRAPSVENVNVGPSTGIKPERTRTIEAEAGRGLGPNIFISTNVYKVSITNPILYAYGNGDSYYNSNHSGTYGIEVNSKWKSSDVIFNMNYAFYRNDTEANGPLSVPGHPGQNLAMPAHKFTANSAIHLGSEDLSLKPTLIFFSERYGYSYDTNLAQWSVNKFDPNLLANLFIARDNFLFKGFTAEAGAKNIFDSKIAYPQPYNSGHAAISESGIEWVLRLAYGVPL